MFSRDVNIVGGRIKQILDVDKWDELFTKRKALKKQYMKDQRLLGKTYDQSEKSFEKYAKTQGLGGDDFPIEINDSFKEAEHPRGQPKNAGQFGSSSGGGSSKTSKKTAPAQSQSAVKSSKDYTSPEGKKSVSTIFKDVGNVSLKMEVTKSKTRENESLISVQGKGLKYTATIDTKAKDFFVDEVHISHTEQGKGIGKNIIRNTVAFAKQEGLKTISLYAGEKAGIYAWAKLGFDYALPTQLGDAKDSLKIFAKDYGVVLTHSQLDKIKRAKDVAEFKIPNKKIEVSGNKEDMEFGKAFMLTSHGAWSGELRL